MAIYSCNLRSIGRTTHAEGTAGAHLRYIGRECAASEVIARHMPDDPQAARTWMDQHERSARKNARLCDKIRLALPRELDEADRAQLVQDYMHGLTQGRVPWYAAIHQTGKDAHNPHAHVVVVDRDIETGKRVLMLSDSTRDREKKGLPGPAAVEWVRERWEHHANQALERAGHEARIDRRTLEAQGIDRQPQIHVGPRAQHIDTQVRRPDSKVVPDPSPRMPDRVIDYPMIDAGRTRRERNAEIIDLNLEREARSPDFETRLWAQFEREQRSLDRPAEAQITAAARRRTLEERRVRRSFAAEEHDARARRDAEGQFSREWMRQRHAPEVQALKTRHAEQARGVAREQDRLFARFLRIVDLTGRTRQRQEEERAALAEQQRREREALAERIRQARATQAEAVRARYQAERADIARAKAQKLDALRARQEAEKQKEDALLQTRAAEREQARLAVQAQVDAWKRMQRDKQVRDKDALAPQWQRQVEGGKARDHGGIDTPTRRRLEKAKEERARDREARSRVAQDWQAARPSPAPAQPDAAEARKKEIAEKWRKERQRRERTRDRGRDREIE